MNMETIMNQTILFNKSITIRFNRNKLDTIIVYYKTHRIGLAEKLSSNRDLTPFS